MALYGSIASKHDGFDWDALQCIALHCIAMNRNALANGLCVTLCRVASAVFQQERRRQTERQANRAANMSKDSISSEQIYQKPNLKIGNLRNGPDFKRERERETDFASVPGEPSDLKRSIRRGTE